ncbi:exodeoxyribonuclease V subunit gamma [Synechococcus sp. CBW1002]|uniref:exodeoxyribonuclease V subunit gamma n=1 Tax=unclassified Synechococcus TaxID=2626047 RepID=UPI0018CCAFA7|nr:MULTISPECIES: exodeoxyribonuclease V subunit gamma [unclassified Synechococcus]QPN58816.1 exodeoxyribonuclease V subunit gamma [Synechococcus sp. CBW1002]QPN65555.1 exodeoxyribonuclease V subunit gamma [Synechococcus sp. CBW1006]
MLTLYRSNRAEVLAQLLAAQLLAHPPGPFERVEILVNTWPTSRWLGEQLAIGLGGIAANLRFPFPGSHLRQLVESLLNADDHTSVYTPSDQAAPAPVAADPWRASQLVWPLLERLPALIERPEALPLRRWLDERGHGSGRPETLDRSLWQLGRSIADAFDDYTLYRPAMVGAWIEGRAVDGRGRELSAAQRWQPLLLAELAEHLSVPPFGLRVGQAIERLREWSADRLPGEPWPDGALPTTLRPDRPLRLFGLSSMAPVQVELLQALSGVLDVEIYLLTPCRELWKRRGDGGLAQLPLGEDWLLEAPRLEARFGRLGAEFQQLLEGSGETQLGAWEEQDLFLGAATMARHGSAVQAPRAATLLEQWQQQLVEPEAAEPLCLPPGDRSLEFHACPGPLRQVQIVRDRLLQLMAADPGLAPRDILVMTPQVEAFAPLVAAVFGDTDATGVALPWRLTDRSQQSEAGIAQGLLGLLALGGERLTASGFEGLLGCSPLLENRRIPASEAGAITTLLQRAGFRWGLDGDSRAGDPTHSLGWAIDRLLLGLVLPAEPGLAPAECSPLPLAGSLEQQTRWLLFLQDLRRWLGLLGQGRTPAAWAPVLRQLLEELFGAGGERAWELPLIQGAIADWLRVAGSSALILDATVVAEVLGEQLSADSGRFGHRSGALTISALEPMRAIPHRVIVLMGLDTGQFPRQVERPGFHLMERQRQLGDPSPADQDRYVLLESLLSARQHLLITWSSRDQRSGEALSPSTPVRQWLALLEQELGEEAVDRLRWNHCANPLERRNFLPQGDRPAPCSDRRLLQARRLLEEQRSEPPAALAAPGRDQLTVSATDKTKPSAAGEAFADLLAWLQAPQDCWLESLGLRPREWARRVDDLEDLSLDEFQRARLLRQELDRLAVDTLAGTEHPAPEPPPPPDWPRRQRGQGVLPPGAAGLLESSGLDQRWTSLHTCLAGLGEPRQETLRHQDLCGDLSWRGDQLVLVHTATPRCRQRLQLWLELLLACAAGAGPRQALLIGRDGACFRARERLSPPSPAEAAAALDNLRQWRQAFQRICWPVPPETGWAYAAAEAKKAGSGAAAACKRWEGGPEQQAERDEEVMALCFGRSLSGRALLQGPCTAHALALHQPLLQVWEELRP